MIQQAESIKVLQEILDKFCERQDNLIKDFEAMPYLNSESEQRRHTTIDTLISDKQYLIKVVKDLMEVK